MIKDTKMYKPICPKCKSQDIGELISYVDFSVNSEGSVHEWLCQSCDYSWEKDELKNNLNIYNQLTCKEMTSDKNDSDSWFNLTFLFAYYLMFFILFYWI